MFMFTLRKNKCYFNNYYFATNFNYYIFINNYESFCYRR